VEGGRGGGEVEKGVGAAAAKISRLELNTCNSLYCRIKALKK